MNSTETNHRLLTDATCGRAWTHMTHDEVEIAVRAITISGIDGMSVETHHADRNRMGAPREQPPQAGANLIHYLLAGAASECATVIFANRPHRRAVDAGGARYEDAEARQRTMAWRGAMMITGVQQITERLLQDDFVADGLAERPAEEPILCPGELEGRSWGEVAAIIEERLGLSLHQTANPDPEGQTELTTAIEAVCANLRLRLLNAGAGISFSEDEARNPERTVVRRQTARHVCELAGYAAQVNKLRHLME